MQGDERAWVRKVYRRLWLPRISWPVERRLATYQPRVRISVLCGEPGDEAVLAGGGGRGLHAPEPWGRVVHVDDSQGGLRMEGGGHIQVMPMRMEGRRPQATPG